MAKQEIEMHGLEEDQVDEADGKAGTGHMTDAERAKEMKRRKLAKAATSAAQKVFVGNALKKKPVAESEEIDEGSIQNINDKLKAHAQRKIDHEAKYGDMSAADKVSHENVRKQLLAQKQKAVAAKMRTESEEIDEMDFSSISKTLSKYGKGVPKDEPKKPTRSIMHTDYTMTGHQEKKSSTGRVYTKAPEMDREPEAIKATVKTDQVEAPKRGRGRPAGATNKAGTGKGWSAEAKASMKAKLAARKAAKLAAKNESEFIEEDWADIVEDQFLDAIVEFMMEEEYQSLDELSKKTLGSYINKSSSAAAGLATTAMHLKNTANMHADASREAEKQGAQLTAVKRDQLSSDYHGYQKDATNKQIKRLVGVRKATDRLTKEAVETNESTEDLNIQRYAALIGKNLIKE